jgi:DNA polymerase III gamma/tau subunit
LGQRDDLLTEEHNLEEIILLADGSIGQALKLLNNDQLWQQRRKFLKFLINLDDKMNLEINELINSLDLGRDLERWDELFKIIKTFYRDLMIVKNINNYNNLINQSYADEIKECSQNYSQEELGKVIKLIEKTNNVIMTNVDCELAFEVMLQKIKSRRM